MIHVKSKTGKALMLAGSNASSRLKRKYRPVVSPLQVTKILTCLFFLSFTGPVPVSAQQGPAPQAGNYLYSCYSNSQSVTGGDPMPDAVDSRNGYLHTPKGKLKILIIFAGFDNDNVGTVPYNDNSSTNPWPQQDADHSIWGTAFPVDLMNKYGYTKDSDFNIANTDNSLSNFYYQMSKGTFELSFGYFPDRINVPYSASNNSYYYYDALVLNELAATASNYPNFDWTEFDKRTNLPNFSSDNSVSAPDGQIDYAIIVWRNTGNLPTPRGGGAHTGLKASKTFQVNGNSYTLADGHAGVGGIDANIQGGFKHEFAHNLYYAPHYNGANGMRGEHLYTNYGWGMMFSDVHTNQCANGWERWYNGWIELQTGANQVNSDVQSAADLPANGEFTLRDFATTGDVVRIKIPHTDQYLWLENHTGNTHWDNRYGWQTSGSGQPFQPAPTGILAFVESMADRSIALSPWNIEHCNGLKTVSGNGNYDYTPDGSGKSNYGGYLWNQMLYNFKSEPNPTGGLNEISSIFLDDNGDGTIDYTANSGNGGGVNEGAPYMAVLDGQFVDGMFGPNIGFNSKGDKMGLSHNPMIIPHQTFDIAANKLSPINLHGLSVEVINFDSNRDITIKVRFDDTDITQSTRWTGDLIMEDMYVNVLSGNTLTINKSGTANRTTQLNGEFVNPTILTMKNGSYLEVQNSATVLVDNGSTLKMEAGSELVLRQWATLIVRGNSILDIADDAVLHALPYSTIIVEDGSQIIIRNNKSGKGLNAYNSSIVRVRDASKINVESGAVYEFKNLSAGYGLILESPQSELNVKGSLKTVTNVNLTFNGSGFIAFQSNSTVDLAANSKVVQSGSGNTDLLYLIYDYTNLNLNPYSIEIQNGKIEYGYGATFTVSGTTGAAVFNNLNFKEYYATAPGAIALSCVNVPTLTMSNCNIAGFFMDGLVLDNVASATLTNTNFTYNGNNSIRSNFKNTNLYLSGCNISGSAYGIYYDGAYTLAGNRNLYLRNKTVISNNSYGVYALTPTGSRLNVIAGDQGCAWVINNYFAGIKGTDVYLDIDAITHKGSACAKQTNRFDGNAGSGGYIFDICYSSSIPNNTINARGNYWGAGFSSLSYRLNTNCSATPVPVSLTSTSPVTCMPVACDICAGEATCIPGGGDVSRMAASGTQTTEQSDSFEMNVYPNPSTENIFLEIQDNEFGASYNYKIMNSIGMVVLEGKLKEKESKINIQSLSKGTYTISLFKDNKPMKSSKIVTVK
ncbi:T9SS type A sorting domain-containing protein [Adhaeribacter terreus]|uniref:T9SS type A sorting domain-containing protein n=1 Tax=Adhaeribacter terreus TaxID=529703 RepID=A0ABW0ECD8_9BACT